MPLYAVYQLEQDGDLLAMPYQNLSEGQVGKTLSEKHNVAACSVKWFGTFAHTDQEAIQKAVESGFKFVPAEEIFEMHRTLDRLEGAQRQMHLHTPRF
ncbi:MAG: hypothetical protein WBK55_04515 [Alphaproteobacteria bacterium]